MVDLVLQELGFWSIQFLPASFNTLFVGVPD